MRSPRRAPDSAAVTALLAGLLAVTPLSIDMPLPTLPGLGAAFGADVARAQLVVSAFLLGFAGAQLAYGPLSDRFGRRPVLLGGLALYLTATAACVAAPSLEWLLAGRLVQGLGACAGPVLARAIVRDVHDGARGARVLSLATMGMSLAPMAAPLVGSLVLLAADWRGVFAVLGAVGATLLLGVHRLLGETNRARESGAVDPRQLARTYGTLATDRRFVAYVTTLMAGSVGLFAFISASPFVLVTVLGLPPHVFALCFAAVNLGQLSGALLSARLTVRLGIDRTIATGLALYVLGGLVMAGLSVSGVQHVAVVVGGMALYQLGNGMVMPNTMAGAIAPFPRMAGAASALAGFSQMLAGAAAGLVVGRLHDGTARPMAVVIAGAALAAALAFACLRPRRPRPP
jgi:DHA1 family bicyclomycin/chloramphenicol resistance-like MFS transporter